MGHRATRQQRCHLWKYVIPHFEQFLAELDLKPAERLDAEGKAERIARSLFAKYYPNQVFTPACYTIVGSYGKGTATKPRTDLDMLFVLPWNEWGRIDALAGNKQSQLLQEVKRALFATFPSTALAADGPVVIAPFQTYNVDIAPAFLFPNDGAACAGQYYIAHTPNGGSWRLSNPVAEYKWLQQTDAATSGKVTHLIKMLKAWKRECNVDIKSVCLEILANLFVSQWEHRNQTIFYYDWMIRDFFAFMMRYANGQLKPAGIDEWIQLDDNWQAKAQTAYNRSVKACESERTDNGFAASQEWQRIFGSQFHIDWVASFLAASIGA